MARGGFPGMGGGNMQQLARQAAKLQQQLQDAQEQLAAREYEAASGGGTARVNGKHELLSLAIKPEAVDPDDVEMLSDMVVAAVNAAMKAAEEDSEKTMGKLTGGINMPGLF